jgi:prepilin-type N-terminal cleavage/methylation domain-containing protein
MNKGFSLIELVVSMAIMLPMLILVLNLVPRMNRVYHTAHAITVSSQLGGQLMDAIVLKSRKTAADFNQNFTQFAIPFEAPFSQFKHTVSDTNTPGIKTIAITVWKDLDNNGRLDSDEPTFTTKRSIVFYKGQ